MSLGLKEIIDIYCNKDLFLDFTSLEINDCDDTFVQQVLKDVKKGQFEQNTIDTAKKYYQRHDVYGYLGRGVLLGFSSLSKVMELLFKSNNIERSGWVNNGLPKNHLESISEHMHHMYLIAQCYLPFEYCEGYDKQTILNMCLIHDLGETVTGDIPHPCKKDDDELVEDDIVRAIMLYLTFFNYDNIVLFDAWYEWSTDSTINAHIAHDLDVVQLNNQLLDYALQFEDVFPVDKLKLWFRRRPQLELTNAIFLDLISDNPKKLELYRKIMN